MGQRKLPWITKRAAVATGAADTDLAAATSTYALVKTTHEGNWYEVQSADDRVEIAFRLSANNTNATFSVYALKSFGDAQLVCTGKAYAGTQVATAQISSATSYWADKINVTTDGADVWPSGVTPSCEDDTSNNKMATLVFQALGRRFILVLVTAVSAGNAAVDMSSYSNV